MSYRYNLLFHFLCSSYQKLNIDFRLNGGLHHDPSKVYVDSAAAPLQQLGGAQKKQPNAPSLPTKRSPDLPDKGVTIPEGSGVALKVDGSEKLQQAR